MDKAKWYAESPNVIDGFRIIRYRGLKDGVETALESSSHDLSKASRLAMLMNDLDADSFDDFVAKVRGMMDR